MISFHPRLGVWGKRVRITSDVPVTLSVVGGDATGSLVGNEYLVSTDPSIGYVVIEADDGVLKEQITIPLIPVMGLIADVIQNFTGLSDQAITLYNNKFDIPKDNGIYLALGILTTKIVGNVSKHNGSGIGLIENNSISISDNIQIKITSRSSRAINLAQRVVMALKSDYSRNIQALYGCKISSIPNDITNVSSEEGDAYIYMFNITIGLMYSIEEERQVNYYDKFNFEIHRG